MRSFRLMLALFVLNTSLLAFAPQDHQRGEKNPRSELRRPWLPELALPAESHLDLPPDVLKEVHEGLNRIFQADPDAAVSIARGIQSRMPEHPIGYLLETEAHWWRLYCQACSIRYNLIDAWSRAKLKEDEAYFAMADRAIKLAATQLTRHESAAMHVFAGMGYGLKARLHGVRGENLAVARTGVHGREHFLRALALEPQMGDALTGLGLYNYLADALSSFAKMLRFFMGIPGGSKKQGIQQLETAMDTAELTALEARFYLARNLRNFDRQYERAAELMEPLVAQYPDNPIFQLLLGNLYAKLNRTEPAALHFRLAQESDGSFGSCMENLRKIAAEELSALSTRAE